MQFPSVRKDSEAIYEVLDLLGLGTHHRCDDACDVVRREIVPAITALKQRLTSAEAELKRGKMVGHEVDSRYVQIEIYGNPKDLHEQLQAAKAEIAGLSGKLDIANEMGSSEPQRIGPPYGDEA